MCLRGLEPSGPQAPQLGEIEHLGEDLQAAVGLVGHVPVLVVEAGDFLAADLGDRPVAEEGEDELLEAPPVLLLRRGLEVHGDVLGIEPGGEILHRHRVAAGIALGQRIDALAQGGEVLDRHRARLLRRHDVDVAQHHPPRPAAGAILQNEALAAGRHHPDAEAGDVVVPGDVVDFSRRQRLDRAFGELAHAAVPDRQSATRSGCGASFSQHYVSKREGNSS